MGEIPEDVKTTAEAIVDELTFVPENYDIIIKMISQAVLRLPGNTGVYVDRHDAHSAILNT
ncbi:hypothetical protein ACU8NH_09400 [Rhizobium leguminosarum]